ncbi:MAG: choline/ethanolamine kinase family protein [Pseudomonadota bacterium]
MTEEEALARAVNLPCWEHPNRPEILGGGITNFNVKMSDGDKTYVVRIGDDIPVHGILRWHELMICRAAHAADMTPAVYYHEPGALVLDFIDAKTFAEDDVRDPNNLLRIVDLVRRCHRDVQPHLRGPILTFWVFHVLRDYAATLRDGASSHVSHLPDLLSTADQLEAAIGPIDVVLGHNDLLAANILDDGTRLWLIDWEYAGFNTPLFDLGGLATNNGLSEPQERQILEHYFEGSADSYWRAYTAMKCASLMRETMWSMVSEIHSTLEFDYSEYTAENMSRLEKALADFRNT